MSKKRIVLLLLVCLSGCQIFPPDSTKTSGKAKSQVFSYDNLAFKTEALAQNYLKNKLLKLLTAPIDSQKLVKEIYYANYKQKDLLKSIVSVDINMFNIINSDTVVLQKKSGDPVFLSCINYISPLPGSPVALAATNITANSFTANWGAVTNATSYNLYIDGVLNSLGNVITYSKTGLTTASSHSYYVQAVSGAGTSPNSNTITLNTSSAPVGEFSSSTTGDESSNAINANGNFVITSSATDIFMKLYNNNGGVISGQQGVNTFTAGTQSWESSAIDANGNVVVTWTDTNSEDGNADGIIARMFNASGVAQGGDFLVNTFITNNQMYPEIAMDGSGNFVIVWQSQNQDLGTTTGIYAQRFNSSGTKIGTEFRVNTWITSNQSFPTVAMNDSGAFVIAWGGAGSSDSSGVYFQRYDSSGNPAGSETMANTYTSNNQSVPVVAMNSSGNFAIAWQSDFYSDENNYSIIGQRFNASGAAQGGEFKVNTYSNAEQAKPTIGMDSTGNFVIAWESNGQDGGGYGIYGQRFNTNGSRYIPTVCSSPACNSSTGEFRINTATSGTQSVPKLSMNSSGDFVTSWRSGPPGPQFSAFAKRYDININEK